MSIRYSNLAGLEVYNQFELIIELFQFFHGLNNDRNRKLLDLPIEVGKTKPLSLLNFFNYYKKDKNKDLNPNRHNIISLVKQMERTGYLVYAGSDKYSMGLERCYHSFKEFTDEQEKGNFWATEILGFSFLLDRAKLITIQITGKNAQGDIECGTGILINENIIITCAHVIKDMVLDKELLINGSKKIIVECKAHSKCDVGYIKVENNINLSKGLALLDPKPLDNILIIGYPKIPQSVKPEIISQKGEVNGSMEDFLENKYLIYSAFTKAGNSGSPIFNDKGYLVGIVSREIFNKNIDYNQVPFCTGIPASEIVDAIRELSNEINLPIENFQ